MENNSTPSSSKTTTNIFNTSSPLISVQATKKPVLVTLKKIGSGFTFVQPNVSVSKIPKLNRTIPAISLLTNNVAPANQGQLTNQTAKVIPTIAITSKNNSNKPNNIRQPSLAQQSITISKQKPIKRTYTKKQPMTKFNFPPPPPKNDFKVSTLTQFTTAIDDQDGPELPTKSCNSLSVGNGSATDLGVTPVTICNTNGVPDTSRLFKKLTIDTRTNQVVPGVSSSVQVFPTVPRRFSGDELRDAIENVSLPCQSQHASYTIVQSFEAPITENDELTTVTDQNTLGEIIKRLDRVEALQLASAKRGAQILVAVKKLCLAYTKYNDDNEEIKKLLPMKNQPEFDAMDIRLTADPTLIEKFRAYLRGFKTSNSPENFSSVLSELMSDELVDMYNYNGIIGKLKLQGSKIVDIIHDLYKPMDTKTFAKLMRTTIDLAKNRYHNDQYRKRQAGIKRNMDLCQHRGQH